MAHGLMLDIAPFDRTRIDSLAVCRCAIKKCFLGIELERSQETDGWPTGLEKI